MKQITLLSVKEYINGIIKQMTDAPKQSLATNLLHEKVVN